MTPSPLCILLLLAASLCSPQSASQPVRRDLTKFTSNELTSCYEDKRICGAADDYDISNELSSRLPSFSTEQLVACFDDFHICGAADSRATGWQISDELATRGDPEELLNRFFHERRMMIRNGIMHVAYHFDTPEVTEFMQRAVRERVYDGEDLYWPANYLAKKCDPLGLHWLRKGIGRNQGSLQYETTLPLFGKCGYRPAIPMLVDDGLFDFSLNIVGGAEESLEVLYPDHPKKFNTLEEEQIYYCRRAKQEGFRLRCKSK